MTQQDRRFSGVYPVLATPFLEDDTLDLEGLERTAEASLRAGASGLVCLGLASEAYKLTDREREAVIAHTVALAGGRGDVIVGTDHASVHGATERARSARSAGATALLVPPPTFGPPDTDSIVDYYRAIADAAGLPIIIQDAPGWTRVPLPPELLLRITEAAPLARYVKVEAPPTAQKMARLQLAGIECVGGLGGLSLPEELDRGVVATMPGPAFLRADAEIFRLYEGGHVDAALALHHRVLPIISFAMTSLDVFVALQKHLLCRRGLIGSRRLREPTTPLDPHQFTWADRLCEAVRLEEFLV